MKGKYWTAINRKEDKKKTEEMESEREKRKEMGDRESANDNQNEMTNNRIEKITF